MSNLWTENGKVLQDSDGKVQFSESCCCSTTTTTTTTTTSTTLPPWGGDGWYCVLYWEGDSCVNMMCYPDYEGSGCIHIETQNEWDTFGGAGWPMNDCQETGPDTGIFAMWACDGVKHATKADCITAGCACATTTTTGA